MAHVDVSDVSVVLDDGTTLLHGVTFRADASATVALIGANGSGKSTLLRVIAGEVPPTSGQVATSGGVALMPQFIGSLREQTTVRDLLLLAASMPVRAAAAELERAERAAVAGGDEARQLAYANALHRWGDAGGYEAEFLWDVCTRAALDLTLDEVAERPVSTLSGGEQKCLVLEMLLRGHAGVLFLDEPDNYLDVPTKEWLERQLAATPKTVVVATHDRELIARTATRIVTLEGRTAWTHGGGFATYAEAREARLDRLDELHRRWKEERERLRAVVRTLQQQAKISPDMASRYRAMQTRLRKFEEAGPPPELPRRQAVKMRLRGGRSGVRVVVCEQFALKGLTRRFDAEFRFGERVAVVGANGTGKSHFLKALAECALALELRRVRTSGECRLGARVVPGYFSQLHEHPEWAGRSSVEILADRGVPLDLAMGTLRRYELLGQAKQRFETLSGGQQARLQILLLDVGESTLLLLDEPTDNLDVGSAEALERALAEYEGTVVAVTHDRWFVRTFDRYLVFGGDGVVYESDRPLWDDARPALV